MSNKSNICPKRSKCQPIAGNMHFLPKTKGCLKLFRGKAFLWKQNRKTVQLKEFLYDPPLSYSGYCFLAMLFALSVAGPYLGFSPSSAIFYYQQQYLHPVSFLKDKSESGWYVWWERSLPPSPKISPSPDQAQHTCRFALTSASYTMITKAQGCKPQKKAV